MSIIDIETFDCSVCGYPIPDRDLEKLAKFRVEKNSLQIICPTCLDKEVKDKAVNKRRESLVVCTT